MPQDNPPLLDKTMNTTESTPRNMADVLASGLANIANNVKPDGSDISISVPGMTATNANDGFSELKGTLADFDFGASTSLTIALNEEWTAPSMGVVSGFIRGNANATAVFGIKSSKMGNAYRIIASVISASNALYVPIDMVVVKGETLTIALLSDVYVGGSTLRFTPFIT